MGTMTVAYMNVGRGCVVTHVYLESCARKEVEICFVGECWVAITGWGTQSHLDYVILGSATKGSKLVALVKRDLLDSVELLVATGRSVVVEVGGCQIGGVYGQCSIGVHIMQGWLSLLAGWIGRENWLLLGDWNAYHHTWSLDERSGPGGKW